MNRSYIIDYLRRTFSQDKVAIAYFYCDYKERDQTADSLTASLLRQLVQSHPALPAKIKSLYKLHSREQTRPSLVEYLRLLLNVTRMFSKAFVLIDALDECSEHDGTRDSLLKALREIGPHVHILITSRLVPVRADQFGDASQLEIRARDEDVATYVKSRIATSAKLLRHIERDPALESTILSKLLAKAQGM